LNAVYDIIINSNRHLVGKVAKVSTPNVEGFRFDRQWLMSDTEK